MAAALFGGFEPDLHDAAECPNDRTAADFGLEASQTTCWSNE
jgi:hypothetical protein